MVGVVVHIGGPRLVHMDLQAALDAFEGADGMLHGLRVQPVGEGDGGRGDAVLGVHPPGCAHADALEDAARPAEVIDEVSAGVRMRVHRMEIGLRIGIMIGQKLRFRVRRRDGDTFLGDDGPAHLRGEDLERLQDMGIIAVDIQMVRVDGRDDGDLREKLVEGTVELVGLRHHHVIVAHEEVCPIIAGDAAQEGGAAFPALREDMGDHRRGGRLAVRARDGETALALRDLAEGEGALDHAVAVLPHEIQFLEHVDGRRPDDEGLLRVGRNEVRTVVIMDADPFCGELRRQVRRGLVIAGHRVSLELEIPGQGAHPDASDAYEIYVLHLVISSLSRNLIRVYMLRRR